MPDTAADPPVGPTRARTSRDTHAWAMGAESRAHAREDFTWAGRAEASTYQSGPPRARASPLILTGLKSLLCQAHAREDFTHRILGARGRAS